MTGAGFEPATAWINVPGVLPTKLASSVNGGVPVILSKFRMSEAIKPS